MGRVGFAHASLTPSKSSISKDGGAKSGARAAPNPIQDHELARIIMVWPELPDHIKAAAENWRF
jgi:hypothetical protein